MLNGSWILTTNLRKQPCNKKDILNLGVFMRLVKTTTVNQEQD